MDILTHILLGLTVSNFSNSIEEKVVIIIASITPDLGELLIQKELKLKYRTKTGVYDSRTSDESIAGNLKITWLYDLLHSPIIYAFVLIINLQYQNLYIRWFCICGFFHILLDFATHGNVWALKLLYPISDFRFKILPKTIGNWWDWTPKIAVPFTKVIFPEQCLKLWFVFTFLYFLTLNN